MRGLTAQNVLEIWEWAESEHPANRALALLSVANPEISWEQLAALSIGQRNTRLIELRELTFGADIQARTVCQHCSESLEFDISTTDIRVADCEQVAVECVEFGQYKINFRLPNSIDLLSISNSKSEIQANQLLLQRCVVKAFYQTKDINVLDLPVDIIDQLSDKISTCDPQAEFLLNLHCPSCNKQAQSEFDINAYLWTEFVDLAKRVMQQVHLLARGYGWHEADILAMSAWRRHYYQELLNL